jgi:hypothetical protein
MVMPRRAQGCGHVLSSGEEVGRAVARSRLGAPPSVRAPWVAMRVAQGCCRIAVPMQEMSADTEFRTRHAEFRDGSHGRWRPDPNPGLRCCRGVAWEPPAGHWGRLLMRARASRRASRPRTTPTHFASPRRQTRPPRSAPRRALEQCVALTHSSFLSLLIDWPAARRPRGRLGRAFCELSNAGACATSTCRRALVVRSSTGCRSPRGWRAPRPCGPRPSL